MTTKTIGILLFDDVEELDAVGPWEVLAYWTRTFPEDDFTVVCLSDDGAPVTCAKGLVIGAHGALADAPPLAVFLHPGGWGTRALMHDADHLERIQALRAATPIMASVCTGSLVYASAGLLAGRPATTHWGSIDALTEADPTIDVTAMWSPLLVSQQASTWHFIWWPAWPGWSVRGKCGAASNTTRHRRSDRRPTDGLPARPGARGQGRNGQRGARGIDCRVRQHCRSVPLEVL